MQHDQLAIDAICGEEPQALGDRTPLLAEVQRLGGPANRAFVSADAFRDALGHYASGITVITGTDEQRPIGFTCQSFYSVSIEPPLVSFSVQKTSTTYPRIRAAGRFAVNVLTRDQQHVSNQFSRSGTDKWSGIGCSWTRSGNPVLDGTMMWLDCRIWAEHDAGDHVIVLGEVEEMRLQHGRAKDPLLYFKGRYRQLAAE